LIIIIVVAVGVLVLICVVMIVFVALIFVWYKGRRPVIAGVTILVTIIQFYFLIIL